MYDNSTSPEKALLVAVDTGEYDTETSIQELYELTYSAGAEPFGSMVQKRPSYETATCVGTGFLQEMVRECEINEIDLIIFDCELTPTQIRNIEEATNTRTIDRTMLILDIFALRAVTKEGKLQVELAQLKYMLPRLTGKGVAMSRLGGGIGTRGPGETKLETDRRHIRSRIESISEKLSEVERHRDLIEQRRKKDNIKTVALMGYTNAGKSTLMNALTGAGVLAENKLFATLDPTARALKLPHGSTVMLIDTVGLVRRLPHHLVEAFKSTLEQAAHADLIINICDASNEEAPLHLQVTNEVLEQLKCEAQILPVWNKCDLLPNVFEMPTVGRGIRISAANKEGLDSLLCEIEKRLELLPIRSAVVIPFSRGDLAARIRKDCVIYKEEYIESGVYIEAELTKELYNESLNYIKRIE